MILLIKITHEDFSLDETVRSLKNTRTGAINIFLGVVRGESDGRSVQRLEVEAYEERALRDLEAIRRKAMETYEIQDVTIIHRTGMLEVTENIVLIVVSAAHRHEAFEACRFVLEELKKMVPIWKKEYTAEGNFWIEGEGIERDKKIA
jgi:molybdopterin synthase catalytic subunit